MHIRKDTAIRDTLLKASIIKMPYAMRKMFVLILEYCDPIDMRQLWNKFSPLLMEDCPSPLPYIHLINMLLHDIASSLEELGRNIAEFDLPPITSNSTTYSTSLVIREEQSVHVPLDDLTAQKWVNDGQR